jgi:hypothetical protein
MGAGAIGFGYISPHCFAEASYIPIHLQNWSFMDGLKIYTLRWPPKSPHSGGL